MICLTALLDFVLESGNSFSVCPMLNMQYLSKNKRQQCINTFMYIHKHIFACIKQMCGHPHIDLILHASNYTCNLMNIHPSLKVEVIIQAHMTLLMIINIICSSTNSKHT